MSKWLRLLTVTMALTLTASAASASGVNLSWSACGALGTSAKTFACNINTGAAELIVASYMPPAGSTAITGLEGNLEVLSSTVTVPDWWMFKFSGSCRTTAVSVAAAGAACDGDYWAGQASGGLTAYITPLASATNRAQLRVIFAVPGALAAPVDPTLEYLGWTTSISHAKTVGTGSCAGCAVPMCIVLNEIKLTQAVGVGDYRIGTTLTNSVLVWQGESPANCLPVPTRNRTWGAVKSLYR